MVELGKSGFARALSNPTPDEMVHLAPPAPADPVAAYHAAMLGDLAGLAAQLAAGVPVTFQADDGSSLLTAAASTSRAALITLLAAAGADVNHVYKGDTVRAASGARRPARAARGERRTTTPSTARARNKPTRTTRLPPSTSRSTSARSTATRWASRPCLTLARPSTL